MVDLHLHTSYSDGKDTVIELINKLIDHHINIFSITDHESFESYSDILNGIKTHSNTKLRYIPGIEISVTLNKSEYHIVTYGKNINCNDIKTVSTANRELREKSDNMFIDSLSSKHEISIAEFSEYTFKRNRGGWKSINYLFDKDIINNINDFFQIFDASGERAEFRHPKDIIKIAKDNSLIPILAHPPAYQNDDLMDKEAMEYWKEIGIMGFECINSYYQDRNNMKEYIDFCNENSLYITGGSDYHGGFNPKELGIPKIKMKELTIDSIVETESLII